MRSSDARPALTAAISAAIVAISAGGLCEVPETSAAEAASRTNPLYFRSLIRKPWWNPDWEYRIPVVVHDPAGFERHSAPISIVSAFPQEAKLSSLRLVMPWGEEVPSQSRLIDADQNRIEVFFVTDLLPHEYHPCFIYFDNEEKPSPAYPSGVSLEEGDRAFAVSSSTIAFKALKSTPTFSHIQATGKGVGNYLYDDNGFSPEGLGELRYIKFSPGTVVESGPLRAVIEYQGTQGERTLTVRYVLAKDANRIDYALSGSVLHVSSSIRWLPGKGVNPARPDPLYYATADGIQQAKIGTHGQLVPKGPSPMAEGWYAYRDVDTGQVAGEIFDRSAMSSFSVYVHIIAGYITSRGHKLSATSSTKGALLALNDNRGYRTVREEYLAFKSPPEVHLSRVQQRSEAPADWQVPVFGRDMILCHHQSYRHYQGTKVYPEAPHRILPHLIRALKRDGANWISMWAYQPFWPNKSVEGPRTEFMQHLVEQAHRAGMGVEVHARATNAQIAAEIAAYDVDIYPLKDESCWRISSERGNNCSGTSTRWSPQRRQRSVSCTCPPTTTRCSSRWTCTRRASRPWRRPRRRRTRRSSSPIRSTAAL